MSIMHRIYLRLEFFGDFNGGFLWFVGIWFILFPVDLPKGHERALRRNRVFGSEGFLQKHEQSRAVIITISLPGMRDPKNEGIALQRMCAGEF